MKRRALIIGAGYTGLSAAYDLSKAGFDVTIFEAEKDIGGLAGTFEILPGRRLEKFYHHWFTSDTAVLTLIEELGLNSRLKYIESNTGLYYSNSIFRLASPLDLLRFKAISLPSRVRTGLMALYARYINNWEPLESITAQDWLIKVGGKEAYEVMWKPLLHGKFGDAAPEVSAVWIWNKLKLRGSSRKKGGAGAESLVYFDGSFGALTDGLRAALQQQGVKIETETPVTKISIKDHTVSSIETTRGSFEGDLVLCTVPLPIFLKLTPELPQSFAESCQKIKFLGNTCLILRLNRSLSSTYWLNVADPTFPFVGIIEHTNFDTPDNYAGEHIAYISKYLPTSDALFGLNAKESFEYSLPYIQKIFPEFSTSWVNGYHLWKASFSQPIITKYYSKYIPTEKTPIKNLWLSTMAQVYPEDRGTNYAVLYGRAVAKKIIESA